MKTEQNKWVITDSEFVNTGGNCWVNVSAVWLPQANVTRYAIASSEGCVLSTADYVRSELEFNNSMLVDLCEWDALMTADKWLSLWERCRFEFIKEDCRMFRHNVFLASDELPPYLLDQMPAGYKEWLDDSGKLVETNGHTIFVDISWRYVTEKDELYITELKNLQDYMAEKMRLMDSDETIQYFYDLKASISFGDLIVTLDNSAAVYTALQDAIKYIIDEL